jgi:hypothetical protein
MKGTFNEEGKQIELPFDIYTEILKHIESVKDLHKICIVNPNVKKYCDRHKKSIFSYLLKNSNFRDNFYNLFDLFIKNDNTTPKEELDKMNWYKIKKLLRFYPVGEMSENSLINNLQVDFLNVFYNITHDEILNNQEILRDIFIILFYPSGADVFSDDALILYRIDKFIGKFVDEKYKHKIIYIYIYHLNNIKSTFNEDVVRRQGKDKELFYEILDNLLKSMMSEIIDEYNVQFMSENLNILIKEFTLSKSYINDIYNSVIT